MFTLTYGVIHGSNEIFIILIDYFSLTALILFTMFLKRKKSDDFFGYRFWFMSVLSFFAISITPPTVFCTFYIVILNLGLFHSTKQMDAIRNRCLSESLLSMPIITPIIYLFVPLLNGENIHSLGYGFRPLVLVHSLMNSSSSFS